MSRFDIVVIGSGPAGQKAAIQAAKMGKRAAVIEKKRSVGGVCINTGTIPSKTLREAIMYFSGMRHREVYGQSYSVKKNITYDDLRVRINHVIRHEVEIVRDQLTRNGIALIEGEASFLDPHRVLVSTEAGAREIRGEKFVIATGTRPYRSDRVPFDGVRVFDSDMVLDPRGTMDALPRSMLVIGAGVIGTEYACMFSTAGVDVRLLDRRKELFRFVDGEICEALSYHMKASGVTFYLGNDFSNIEVDQCGKVNTTLNNGRRIISDMLLFCSGRTGASDALNLNSAGVKTTDRGLIEVNDRLQTSQSHIYAAGDIIGFPSLASTSMEQGRRAACHAFGVPYESQSDMFPYGIYTIPEISMVGKTEEELLEAGVPYEVGIGKFNEIARGKIIGDNTGMVKLIFHQQNGKMLGAHILGDGAAELIHIAQAVLSFGGSIDYFVNSVFNYPTLAEAYKVAALNGLNRMGWKTNENDACEPCMAEANNELDTIMEEPVAAAVEGNGMARKDNVVVL